MNEQLGITLNNLDVDYIKNMGFKRLQICHSVSRTNDIRALFDFVKENDVSISYHSPVYHQFDARESYFLSSNSNLRRAALEVLEMNLRLAKNLPTNNVVIHFASKDIEDGLDSDDLFNIARESAAKISKLSKEYNLPISFEYFGYNDKFYKTQSWVKIISKYENLGLCLDVGHFYISCLLHGMDYFDELIKILPHIKIVHLWNTRGLEDISKYGHIPVNPDQNRAFGWIDIERTLRIILRYNKNIPIIFEPDFNYGNIEYIKEGIIWIDELIDEIRSEEDGIYEKVYDVVRRKAL